MILKDFLAISGQPGLFKFIAQGKNAIIVEDLETKKRNSAFSSARVSHLDEISIFTDNEDVPLAKVFDLMYEKENGGPSIDHKIDPEKLKSYFAEVLPGYSRERVYSSDIKKVVHWYNILQKQNLLVKEEPEKPAETEKKPAAEKKAEAKKVPVPKKKEAEVKKVSVPKKKEAEAKKAAVPKKEEAAKKVPSSKKKGTESRKQSSSGKKETAPAPGSKVKPSKPKGK